MAPNQKINLKDKVEDGEMDLGMLNLQEVPVKDIAQYKKVFSLDLSNNHLVSLPKNFSTLTNLTKLDLSKNKLRSLPDNFGGLTKLKYLDLYKNELQHLPVTFSELKSLRWLDLKDNPLVPVVKETAGQCLDQKQCQQCATSIVQFFTQLKEKIEEERQVRERQRQKDKLANEQAAQKAKHLEKKNKKREKAKQHNDRISKDYSEELPKVMETKANANYDSSRESSSFFVNLILLFLFLTVTLFVLTSVKYEKTQFVEENVRKYWGVCLEKVPPAMQDAGNLTGLYIEEFHQRLGKYIVEMKVEVARMLEMYVFASKSQ